MSNYPLLRCLGTPFDYFGRVFSMENCYGVMGLNGFTGVFSKALPANCLAQTHRIPEAQESENKSPSLHHKKPIHKK